MADNGAEFYLYCFPSALADGKKRRITSQELSTF